MDLTGRGTYRRASVLVVEVPGWARTRWAAERDLRRRGWRTASSAADADVLLVCGPPGQRLAAVCDAVWQQMPGPRARVDASDPFDVVDALDRAASALADGRLQRADATQRSTDPVPGPAADLDDGAAGGPDDAEHAEHAGHADDHPEGDDPEGDDPEADDPADDPGDDAGAHEQGGMDHGDTDHGDTDHGDTDHGDTDHGDTDHGDTDHGDMDHGDMDHGDMEMAPGGIPLAGSGGEDRDGLEMDVLSVPLGPVLPCWPPGLVLHCTLAGDVVVRARAEVLGPAEDAELPGPEHGSAADRLDRSAQLLLLAGVADAAATAARLRDDAAAGTDPAATAAAVGRLARRIRRNRLLRWALGGTGTLDAAAHGLGDHLAGTVHDRLVAALTAAHDALRGHAPPSLPTAPGALPGLVEGLELGAVRLLVAGLDVDPLVDRARAVA